MLVFFVFINKGENKMKKVLVLATMFLLIMGAAVVGGIGGVKSRSAVVRAAHGPDVIDLSDTSYPYSGNLWSFTSFGASITLKDGADLRVVGSRTTGGTFFVVEANATATLTLDNVTLTSEVYAICPQGGSTLNINFIGTNTITGVNKSATSKNNMSPIQCSMDAGTVKINFKGETPDAKLTIKQMNSKPIINFSNSGARIKILGGIVEFNTDAQYASVISNTYATNTIEIKDSYFKTNKDFASGTGIYAQNSYLSVQNSYSSNASVMDCFIQNTGYTPNYLSVRGEWTLTEDLTVEPGQTFAIGAGPELGAAYVCDGNLIIPEGITLTNNGTVNTLGTGRITIASENSIVGNPIGGTNNVQLPGIDIADAIVTLSRNTFTYNKTAQAPTVTVTLDGETLIANTDYTLAIENDNNNINVGTYTITITGAGDYVGTISETYTITPKTLTWNAGTVLAKDYDGNTNATVANQPTLSGVVGGDSVTVTNGTVAFVSANAGTQSVTAIGYDISGDIANYEILAQPTFANGTINKKQITVTPNANQSKVFGANDPTFTYTNTTLIGTDTISGTLAYVGTNAGTYPLTLGTLAAGDNYTLVLGGSVTFEIKKAAAGDFVTPSAISVTYVAGLTLSAITLPNGYAWVSPTTTLNAGDSQSFAATYNVSANHEAATGTIIVNVAKATVTTPTGLTAKVGQTLAEVTLPAGWAWVDDLATLVGEEGTRTFKATYTPTDTANFNTLTDVNITITVTKVQVGGGGKGGLGTGGVVGIVLGVLAVLGGGGFAAWWFVFRKRNA
jgi:hypothetical protein